MAKYLCAHDRSALLGCDREGARVRVCSESTNQSDSKCRLSSVHLSCHRCIPLIMDDNDNGLAILAVFINNGGFVTNPSWIHTATSFSWALQSEQVPMILYQITTLEREYGSLSIRSKSIQCWARRTLLPFRNPNHHPENSHQSFSLICHCHCHSPKYKTVIGRVSH